MMDMNHKLCVITGANSGIGKATATELARQGAYVLMVCRNEEKAKQAQSEIVRDTGNTGVDIILANLALQYDVRKAAETIRSTYDKVDLLINNAGYYPAGRRLTPEGIERTFAVNHLSHFLLTHLLMDPLKAADRARVIHVASEAHRAGAPFFDPENLMLEEGYSPMKAYGLSKLCNIMFGYELAKRTAGSSVTSYSLHPGVIGTNLASEGSWIIKLAYWLGKPFMRTSESGAETSLHLATSDPEQLEGLNGHYFKNKKPAKPADIAFDDTYTEILWNRSLGMAGL